MSVTVSVAESPSAGRNVLDTHKAGNHDRLSADVSLHSLLFTVLDRVSYNANIANWLIGRREYVNHLLPIDPIQCIYLAMFYSNGRRRTTEEHSNVSLFWVIGNLAGPTGVGLLNEDSIGNG